jgi:amidohydrolase
MTPDFTPLAYALASQLTAWRRDLHRHPETAFQEERTAGVVADHLIRLGLEVQTGVGQTGVVGILEGAQAGPTAMLRFDMDALPLREETGLPFASQVPGNMHACGHDGHTAIGLGVATLLAGQQGQLAGRVKFVFQPAEEIAQGARAMIGDGALANPAPEVMFGLHLWSQIPLGQAVVKAGPLWASSDRFALEIVGRGSHGAMPHQGIDAIAVAAYAVAQLQTIVSRDRDPLQPAVLSIGTIRGGDAFNILAERVQMSGTLRTFDLATRARILERMDALLAGVCAAHGASYQLTWRDFTPPVVNDAAATEHLRAAAAAVLGEAAVAGGPMMMVAEDVSEFLDRTPGSFFVLGAMPQRRARSETGPSNEEWARSEIGNHPGPWLAGSEDRRGTGPSEEAERRAEPHHSPRFDIDERALPLGAAILTQATFEWLNRHVSRR